MKGNTEMLHSCVKLHDSILKMDFLYTHTFIKWWEGFAKEGGIQTWGGDGEPGRYSETGSGQPQRRITGGEKLISQQLGHGRSEHRVSVQHPTNQSSSNWINVLNDTKNKKHIAISQSDKIQFKSALNIQQ